MPNSTKLIRRPSSLPVASKRHREQTTQGNDFSGVLPEIAHQLDEVTQIIVELEAALAARAQRYAVRYEFLIHPKAQHALKEKKGTTTSAAKKRTEATSETDLWKVLAGGAVEVLIKEYIVPHLVFEYACLTKVKGVWGLFYEVRQLNTPATQIPLREAPADKKRLFMQFSEQFVDGFEKQVQKAITNSGIEEGKRALAKLREQGAE